MLTCLENISREEFGQIVVKSDEVLGYLGMQVIVNKNNGDITISQPNYAMKLLKESGYQSLKVSKTSGATTLSHLDGDEKLVDVNNYLKLIGLINYPAVFTRPVIVHKNIPNLQNVIYEM